MVEMKVESIRVSLMTQHRVVILKELTAERYLPIWIGPFEADAIALELQEVHVARPLTHDLLRSVITELGATVTHVLINELRDDTYFARIVLDIRGRHAEVDCRPSDAIALAVRVKTRIFVEDGVLERAAMTLDESSGAPNEEGELRTTGSTVDDERLSVFRDFINSLDMDDLDRPPERS